MRGLRAQSQPSGGAAMMRTIKTIIRDVLWLVAWVIGVSIAGGLFIFMCNDLTQPF
jgi:hypothetical protein